MVIHPSALSQAQSMPRNQSYSSRPAFHSSKKKPACTHSWKRSWAVEPGQNFVASNAFHWQPVRSTKKMASKHTRSGTRGRPPPKRCVFGCGGISHWISSHKSSGARQSSGTSVSLTRTPSSHAAVGKSSAAAPRSYNHRPVIRIGSYPCGGPTGAVHPPRGSWRRDPGRLAFGHRG